MIIDCHGHYTTAPKKLHAFRDAQIAAFECKAVGPDLELLAITDDEIRETLVPAQLKLQQERGTDISIFSPGAGRMAHHVGDFGTSQLWAMACNDLIARVVGLYPETICDTRPRRPTFNR